MDIKNIEYPHWHRVQISQTEGQLISGIVSIKIMDKWIDIYVANLHDFVEDQVKERRLPINICDTTN